MFAHEIARPASTKVRRGGNEYLSCRSENPGRLLPVTRSLANDDSFLKAVTCYTRVRPVALAWS
jgi:hypothetical protein